MQTRQNDITPLVGKGFSIQIDDKPVSVTDGETVLSAMFSIGKKSIMENDHKVVTGAYCGMGVCHSCLINVDGQYKQRACKTLVKEGMKINTQSNRFKDIGIID